MGDPNAWALLQEILVQQFEGEKIIFKKNSQRNSNGPLYASDIKDFIF